MKNMISTSKLHRTLGVIVATVLLSMSGTTSASLVTMTFNNGPLVGLSQYYAENGMEVVGDVSNSEDVFSISDLGSDGNYELYNSGSCGGLSFGFDNCAYMFSTGEYFDLISIDLVFKSGGQFIASSGASVSAPGTPSTLDFTGLSGWTGLTSFTWYSIGESYIDNVVFRTHTKVPEPATIALIGFGLIGLYIGRRREPQKKS